MSETEKKSLLGNLRRIFIGAPIASRNAAHEKLTPLIGLAVFSSDALSSVAYATEAILAVLILYSQAAMGWQFGITIGICLLIGVVALSYNQTIHAYPSGGGSYIVASENLGESPGLIAGAALLVDYILTVAVSVAAGIAALSSAFPAIEPHKVMISILAVALIAWANLRGVKESGVLFAIPTYTFVVLMFAMISVGVFKALGTPFNGQTVVAMSKGKDMIGAEANFAVLFILGRAFAAGCTALTGIEAVSNGVQAFKEPVAKNASTTLWRMTMILGTMFVGVGYVVQHLPSITLLDPTKTVVSQVAAWTFGQNSPMFFAIQFATAAILVLAANTAYADFPRLSSLIARDGFLPRPLARQGDRLVFHNGIIFLAGASALLIFVFKGELDLLLPLYAVGVFTAFTLSQTGMVIHWKNSKEPGWIKLAIINGIGAVATLIVTLVIGSTKFTEGAWIVIILLAILYRLFKAIRGRYDSISRQLALDGTTPTAITGRTTLLMVPRVHKGILSALQYSKALDPNICAIHVAISKRHLPEVRDLWEQYGEGVPLVVLNSPFRSLIEPIMDYTDKLLEENPNQVVTVIVPEAVSLRWYHKLLQENVAIQLKNALGTRKNVVVSNVRYFLD